MEVSARPLSLLWLCVDLQYDFIPSKVDKECSADAVRIASTNTANLYTYGIILGLFHKLDCHSSVDHLMNTALLVYSPDTHNEKSIICFK
jgi:hypothetical protein